MIKFQIRPFRSFLCVFLLTASVFAQESKEHSIDKTLSRCEQKQGAYTRGEAECLSQAFDSWEKDITETYDALKAFLPPARLKSLEVGQTKWAEYRDEEFDLIGGIFPQRGTLYVPLRIRYRIEVVKARALELERYLQRVKRTREKN